MKETRMLTGDELCQWAERELIKDKISALLKKASDAEKAGELAVYHRAPGPGGANFQYARQLREEAGRLEASLRRLDD